MFPEAFVLPYQERYILSFPLSGHLFLVNAALVNALRQPVPEISERVFSVDLDLPIKTEGCGHAASLTPEELGDFAPTSVVIFVTNGCNLNCKYCFATPQYRRPQFIDPRFARAGMELAARNAARKGAPFGIHFSGGEPLLNPSFTARLTEYAYQTAARHHVPLHLGLTTNGNIDAQTARFTQRRFDYVSFSVDGPPDVQDSMRPTAHGDGGFARLDRALGVLMSEAKPRVEIRSTFTAAIVDKMADNVEYFYRRWGVSRFCFVPLRETTRSRKSGLGAPSSEALFQAFIEADARADALGVTLYYSAHRHGPVAGSPHFCAISRDYFGLTQDGFVTACSQFPRQHPSRNPLKFYLYGKFDEETGRIVIDEDKRRMLHQLHLANKQYCLDCFARWSCKGDCPARLFGYPEGGKPDFLEMYREFPSPYCPLNQMLAYYYALKRLGLPFISGGFQPGSTAPRHRITTVELPHLGEDPKVFCADGPEE